MPKDIPDTVTGTIARNLYTQCNNERANIKDIAGVIDRLRPIAAGEIRNDVSPEVVANITLAYRHLEDASMRLGKALQALDGGVSVYDRATTVGA